MTERNRLQNEVSQFTDFIGANKWTQLGKFVEEVGEAIDAKEEPLKFAEELTDVCIVAIGLIHCMGLSFEDLFDEKMRINWQKYAEIRAIKESGLPHHEAQRIIKDRWSSPRQ